MSDLEFSSLNPYGTLRAIVADSPEALVAALTAIQTPIKIVAMTTYGTRQVAYVMGHLPRVKQTRNKPKKGSDYAS